MGTYTYKYEVLMEVIQVVNRKEEVVSSLSSPIPVATELVRKLQLRDTISYKYLHRILQEKNDLRIVADRDNYLLIPWPRRLQIGTNLKRLAYMLKHKVQCKFTLRYYDTGELFNLERELEIRKQRVKGGLSRQVIRKRSRDNIKQRQSAIEARHGG